MRDWINISDELPKNGQRVHIVTQDFYNWQEGQEGEISYHTATFCKGKVPKRGESISSEDQHGNNRVPYNWRGDGPMTWFGQDVLYWKSVIEPAGLRTNPEWLRRCEMNLRQQRQFKATYGRINKGKRDEMDGDFIAALAGLSEDN